MTDLARPQTQGLHIWVATETHKHTERCRHITQAHTDIQYKDTHPHADIHKQIPRDIVTDINTKQIHTNNMHVGTHIQRHANQAGTHMDIMTHTWMYIHTRTHFCCVPSILTD